MVTAETFEETEESNKINLKTEESILCVSQSNFEEPGATITPDVSRWSDSLRVWDLSCRYNLLINDDFISGIYGTFRRRCWIEKI